MRPPFQRSLPLSHLAGALEGCAAGDRLGLPVEVLGPEEILAYTDGLGITHIIPVRADHKYFPVANPPLGVTSDDWGLSAAMIRACLVTPPNTTEPHAFALSVAREHVHALHASGGNGWGTGTKNGTREMARWLDGFPGGRAPWLPTLPGPNAGSGNGVGIKMGVIGLIHAMQLIYRDPADQILRIGDVCTLVGQMTHINPDAWIAGEAMAHAASYALRIGAGDKTLPTFSSREDVVQRIIEDIHRDLSDRRIPEDSKVLQALAKLTRPGLLDDPVGLRKEIGTSVNCWESVPFAIATWLRHMYDPRAAGIEVVNAGGDTDSTGSMTLLLAGAVNGLDSIPLEWRVSPSETPFPDEGMPTILATRLIDLYVDGALQP